MRSLFFLPIALLAVAGACSPAGETPESAPTPPAQEEAADTMPAAPATQPADEAAEDVSCRAELGEEAAAELVDQCIQMSPATHPPCNAQNSCQMIRNEIARGCNFGDGAGNPDFCAQYEE